MSRLGMSFWVDFTFTSMMKVETLRSLIQAMLTGLRTGGLLLDWEVRERTWRFWPSTVSSVSFQALGSVKVNFLRESGVEKSSWKASGRLFCSFGGWSAAGEVTAE